MALLSRSDIPVNAVDQIADIWRAHHILVHAILSPVMHDGIYTYNHILNHPRLDLDPRHEENKGFEDDKQRTSVTFVSHRWSQLAHATYHLENEDERWPLFLRLLAKGLPPTTTMVHFHHTFPSPPSIPDLLFGSS
jgi:hypothetical protein